MNIRLSLKMIFLSGTLIYGAVMAYVFFVFAFDFYIQGSDNKISELMIEAARSTDLDEQSTFSALGFTITDKWERVPEKYRQSNPESPTKPFELRQFARFSKPDSAPDEIDYLLMVQDEGKQPIYVSKSLSRLGMDIGVAEPAISWYDWAILVGIGTAVAFSLLLILTLRMSVKPLEDLQSWAESLSTKNLHSPAPSFKYKEFSSLAEIVRQSLLSVSVALENEREFLQYASHELRSPLTVMRSNVDLLNKKKQFDADSAQSPIIQRIERATLTMSQLIQTLLWLSRDEQPGIVKEEFSLEALTREVVDELDYLRTGKDIDVQLKTMPYTICASKSACRIAISNLVRNAFQHSESGVVSISQNGELVSVCNPLEASPTRESNELGFGLGTKLTNKLADKFHWRFSTKSDSTEFFAEIAFSTDCPS